MPNYTIRVELKGYPDYSEYERLHTAMATLGFSQTIEGVNSSGDSGTWTLPHALYFGLSYSEVGTVRDSVAAVARNIQSGVVVFVAQTETWAIANYP